MKKLLLTSIAVVIFTILAIASCFAVSKIYKYQAHRTKLIYGVVQGKENDIISIKTDNNKIVEIFSDEKVSKGDVVEVTYYDVGYDTLTIIDVIASNDELNQTTTITQTTTVTTTKKTTKKITEEVDKDRVVIDYVKEVFTNIKTSDTLDSLKKNVIKLIDFVFYGKKINDVTFAELKTETKAKVMYYVLIIDNKIEEIIPNYKEKLGDKYQNFKSKLVTSYLEIVVSICDTDTDACNKVKEDFNIIKSKINITWNNLKDVIMSTGDKTLGRITDWYKIWSGKE